MANVCNSKNISTKIINAIIIFVLLILVIFSSTSCIEISSQDIFDKIYPNISILIVHIVASVFIICLSFWLVWQPTKKMINARRELAAKTIIDSDKAKKEAYNRLVEAEQKRMEAYAQANEIIENAKKESYIQHNKIIEEAHKTAQLLSNKAKIDAENMKSDLMNKSNQRAIEMAYLTSQEILKRELSISEDDKILNDFINELAKKDEEAKG